jgi:CubicO group peptidase (beta-lactamase class C family)
MFGKNKESFGHNGWGGSLGFGDPIEGIGIAYVTRKINEGMGADLRAVDLIKKTYKILNS